MSDDAARKQRGRPFKPGTSGNPRGRPKGSRNKRTLAQVETAAAAGEAPLNYMLRVMRDVTVPADRRDEMAKAAAPYVHPKLAPARQEGFYDLSRLSDQELQTFEFLTLKALGEPKPV
jgi:hypothetical protein